MQKLTQKEVIFIQKLSIRTSNSICGIIDNTVLETKDKAQKIAEVLSDSFIKLLSSHIVSKIIKRVEN